MNETEPEQPQADNQQPPRPEATTPTTQTAETDKGKMIAVVSYITLIGWIIALILHQNDRTSLGAFHLRQVLGLGITALVLSWIPYIGWIIGLAVLVLWIMGLVNAAQEKEEPVPLVGDFYQQALSFIR